MANTQKTPFQRVLNRIIEGRTSDILSLLGKSLPASVESIDATGTIVTCKFQVQTDLTLPTVTVPVFGPEYIRYPIQAGCKGVLFAASTVLGGVSGLGNGLAPLTTPSNLSGLVFFPVGNSNFSNTDDPNFTVIYGPDGTIIRAASGTAKITVKKDEIDFVWSTFSMTMNSTGLVINAPVMFDQNVSGSAGTVNFGSTNIVTTGNINAAGITGSATVSGGTVSQGSVTLGTHHHTGVTIGSGNTGGPV